MDTGTHLIPEPSFIVPFVCSRVEERRHGETGSGPTAEQRDGVDEDSPPHTAHVALTLAKVSLRG